MTNKIIFLDIDGVVCTEKSHDKSVLEWYGCDTIADAILIRKQRVTNGLYIPSFNTENWPFDTDVCALLHKLVRDHDIKFVISSTWRRGETIETLTKKFKLKGLHIPIIGLTKVMHQDRGIEINRWLEETDIEIEKYAIIDDDTYDILPHCDVKNVITTKYKYGFDQVAYNELKVILGI